LRSSLVVAGNCGLTCGNVFAALLNVVGDRRTRPDFLRTICGPREVEVPLPLVERVAYRRREEGPLSGAVGEVVDVCG
jgi:hypothetical protein